MIMLNDIIDSIDEVISDILDDELFYSGASGSGQRFLGQFTRSYVDQGQFQSWSPKVLCKDGVFDFAEDDVITFKGVDYQVMNAQPDGEGLVEVVLKNA